MPLSVHTVHFDARARKDIGVAEWLARPELGIVLEIDILLLDMGFVVLLDDSWLLVELFAGTHIGSTRFMHFFRLARHNIVVVDVELKVG